jgi:hypothetical protein
VLGYINPSNPPCTHTLHRSQTLCFLFKTGQLERHVFSSPLCFFLPAQPSHWPENTSLHLRITNRTQCPPHSILDTSLSYITHQPSTIKIPHTFAPFFKFVRLGRYVSSFFPFLPSLHLRRNTLPNTTPHHTTPRLSLQHCNITSLAYNHHRFNSKYACILLFPRSARHTHIPMHLKAKTARPPG